MTTEAHPIAAQIFDLQDLVDYWERKCKSRGIEHTANLETRMTEACDKAYNHFNAIAGILEGVDLPVPAKQFWTKNITDNLRSYADIDSDPHWQYKEVGPNDILRTMPGVLSEAEAKTVEAAVRAYSEVLVKRKPHVAKSNSLGGHYLGITCGYEEARLIPQIRNTIRLAVMRGSLESMKDTLRNIEPENFRLAETVARIKAGATLSPEELGPVIQQLDAIEVNGVSPVDRTVTGQQTRFTISGNSSDAIHGIKNKYPAAIGSDGQTMTVTLSPQQVVRGIKSGALHVHAQTPSTRSR